MNANKQFFRYVVVGVASNLTGYLLYLTATWLGTGPKTAMTALYVLGVLQTFFFNKRWSFRFGGAATPALARYAVAYAVGYCINLLGILLLVDRAGLPHQLVQGMMIAVVATMLFVAQRYWVFPQDSRGEVA